MHTHTARKGKIATKDRSSGSREKESLEHQSLSWKHFLSAGGLIVAAAAKNQERRDKKEEENDVGAIGLDFERRKKVGTAGREKGKASRTKRRPPSSGKEGHTP